MLGVIDKYDPQRKYGYVISENGATPWFHERSAKPAGDHHCLLVAGTEVLFDYDAEHDSASNVLLVDPPALGVEESTVSFIVPGRQKGWAERQCGCGISWHCNQIVTYGYETLRIGSLIRHTLAQTDSGRWHAADIEIFMDEPSDYQLLQN